MVCYLTGMLFSAANPVKSYLAARGFMRSNSAYGLPLFRRVRQDVLSGMKVGLGGAGLI